MSLFKRKNPNQDNFDQFYDEDGYFIDTPTQFGDDDGYFDYNNRPTRPKRRPAPQTKHYETNVGQDDYFDNDYDPGAFYSADYDDAKVRQSVNIKVLTVLFLYIIFLILGIFNTTFESGYVPQIINADIKSQRVIYEKAMDEIQFLEQLDDFKGIQELQELSKTGHYQERIPPLQAALKKVNGELESLQSRAYKIKETDYLKVEMMYMVNDLLTSEASTLQLAIQYYQQLSGYTSTNNPQISQMQNQLIDQHNQYKTKMANYKVRFEQIKVNNLLLYE